MFKRCLFCHEAFPANETLEHFPLGRRVAYDPDRGRLWAVCTSCRRWTLSPMEERWEALEELESRVTSQRPGPDAVRLLSRTEHVALFRTGRLDVVRVGSADRREEAWWRYGRSLVERRSRHIRIAAAGAVVLGGLVVGGVAAGVGVAVLAQTGNLSLQAMNLYLKRGGFGKVAWKGEAPCVRCGAVLRSIGFNEEQRLRLVHPEDEEDAGYGLRVRCYRCGAASPEAGYRLEGLQAEHYLRRSLARKNAAGASEREVRSASRIIEEAGSPVHLLRAWAGGEKDFTTLGRTERVALEIAANDDAERRLLELELAALETRWREEERLAAIIDGELTWVAGPGGWEPE